VTTVTPHAQARATVLYDGDCGFCKWSLAKLLAWDRRGALRPLPLQDPEADRLLGGMESERKLASWHLVAEDGSVVSAGRALAPLFGLLPGGRPLAALASALGPLTEPGYGWVAGHRDVFGKAVSAGARRRASARIARRSAGAIRPER